MSGSTCLAAAWRPLTALLAAATLLLSLTAAQAQAQAGASPAAAPPPASGNLLAIAESDLPPECTAADLVPANITFLGAAGSALVGEPERNGRKKGGV